MASRIGVCSWSLAPDGVDRLIQSLDSVSVRAIQLALAPLLQTPEAWRDSVTRLRDAGITVLSGMFATIGEDYATLESIRRTGGIAPDEHWGANLERAGRVADLAAEFGIGLVTFHAGFIPHDKDDPRRDVLLDRLGAIADCFGERDVDIGLETGQETAGTLLAALEALKHDRVSVNFDPANMILYGMGDPVAALSELAPHVSQIHIKDAIPTVEPGRWGTEAPAGEGAVDWSAFFEAAAGLPGPVDYVIEREAGENRLRDIARARDLVAAHLSEGAAKA